MDTPDNLRFTEEMKGYITLGEADQRKGCKEGKQDKRFAMFHLTIAVTDVDRFVADPDHEASATGWVEAESLGGRMAVEKGIFKDVKDDSGFDVWTDTSTLYTRILRGHVDAGGEASAEVVHRASSTSTSSTS